jgi:probable F420-dependent oxidoreductase
MKIGFFSYNTDYGVRPDILAKALEERAFDSLWVGEHTHIPAKRETPFPGGIELPRPYYHMMDPMVSLAIAASVTRNLRVGTGISLVVQHDPIVLAKSISTLDHLSNGRFELGIGGGWLKEEMENHGFPFSKRWKLLRERIEAVKEIWDNAQATYSGEFVNFENIISNPKPIQKPHPPILMGGATKNSLKRVARYCDGWMPIDALLSKPADMISQLHSFLKDEDRDPSEVLLSVFCQRNRDLESLKAYEDAGFTRAIIALPNKNQDETLRFIDSYIVRN